MLPNLQLVAVEIGQVFTAVFLIVMFLGWVMQAVQGQNQQGPVRRGGGDGERGGGDRPGGRREPPQQRPRPDRIRSEIDAFLEEVEPRGGRRPEPEPVIEIVEPSRPRPQQRPRPERPRPERQRPERQRPRAEQQPPPAETDRDLGAGLRSHVTDYMASHLGEEVEEHLPHLAPSVDTAQTGSSVTNTETVARAVHPIVAQLRDPTTVRQAVLLMEILSPPRLLRNRD